MQYCCDNLKCKKNTNKFNGTLAKLKSELFLATPTSVRDKQTMAYETDKTDS